MRPRKRQSGEYRCGVSRLAVDARTSVVVSNRDYVYAVFVMRHLTEGHATVLWIIERALPPVVGDRPNTGLLEDGKKHCWRRVLE